MLSKQQIAQYHEDGYIVPDFSLSEDTLTTIRKKHDQLVQNHPAFTDYCPALLPFDASFVEFARNETILDMVSQLIGDDIALWNCSFFAKPARIGSKTPWHQDGQYWPIRPLATCTVWIAVDDSTVENGCLQVIRGSHQDKQLQKHHINDGPGLALNQELAPEQIQDASVENIELIAGQISLHDVYLVHGSEPNQSALPRRGMTLRFMPTTSHYDRSIEHQQYADAIKSAKPQGAISVKQVRQRPLYLMRGVDRCGQNDFAGDFTRTA